jgi:Fe-S-cluster containining protein
MKDAQVYYQCQRCGNCCRRPGFVRLGQSDCEGMADYLGLTVEDFTSRYTELHPSRKGLVLRGREDGPCIFLSGRNECLVQDAKPQQCRGFPNRWNFPGWREMCEARPVRAMEKAAR